MVAGAARIPPAGLAATPAAWPTCAQRDSPRAAAGRVKTLHPGVHGGILARRDLPAHMDAIQQHGIATIDLVIVNLYPFRQTVTAATKPSYEVSGRPPGACMLPVLSGGPPPAALLHAPLSAPAYPHGRPRMRCLSPPEAPASQGGPALPACLSVPVQVAVENIDIGGPAMIRAAAKNHEHVTVVVDPADYAQVGAPRLQSFPASWRMHPGCRPSALPGFEAGQLSAAPPAAWSDD